MQVVSTARLSRVTKLLRLSLQNSTSLLSSLQYSAHIRQLDATMANQIFKGQSDYYNGLTIDSVDEACDNKIFAQRLKGNGILLVTSSCFLYSQIKL